MLPPGLLVRDGFLAEAEASGAGHAYTPPPGWNGKLKDEWVFHYTRRAAAWRAHEWLP